MGLATFIPDDEPVPLSLAVVNPEMPAQVQMLLDELFDEQPVAVTNRTIGRDIEEPPANVVYLLDGEKTIASSPLSEVADSFLLVNSDIYVTGARDVRDVDLPNVIRELDETAFRLRGYPESNKEKLLLITISRHIERLSLEAGGGTHRAAFQYLSRMTNERGTRVVYEQLADSDVDVHVYGVLDWTPRPDCGLTVHGGQSPDFTDSWFVVHLPDKPSATHAALLAVQDGPKTWNGFWTYDTDTVQELNRYIEREM